jgi:electron transport complex protein RnfC
MGGASFPTHVKLSPPAGKKIDTLILNGAECEPYLTADHRLMLERTADIITGVKILMRILDVETAYIAVENNKPDAIDAFEQVLGQEKKITCRVVKTKYPQGGEKQLINALTGREVPSGGLPMDCGCVVHNIGTTVAVMEAVCMKRPLIDRVVTVTGPGVQEPKNMKVRIGTTFETVLKACGGLRDLSCKVISGGPMMGITQWSMQVPVVKATSGILCITENEAVGVGSYPCISCGSCLRACPIHLMPTRIVQTVALKRWEAIEKLHILDCVECGSCSYVCPSKINLIHYIKWGKFELLENRKKAGAARSKGTNGKSK